MRHVCSIYWIGIVIALTRGSSSLFAQQLATTVQLPTFSSFSVNTSVSVPDSGGPYRDLIRRSRFGQVRPHSPLSPHWKAIGRQANIRAPWRDHGYSADEIGPAGNLIVRRVGQPAAGASRNEVADQNSMGQSLAELQRDRARAMFDREQAIRQGIAQGRDAAARGRWGSARIFLQTAARQASGALRDEALAELAALDAQRLAERPENGPR